MAVPDDQIDDPRNVFVPGPTLGRRLDDAGRQLARRHLPDFAWAYPLLRAIARAERLGTAPSDRFARQEVPPEGPHLTDPVRLAGGRRTRAPAAGGHDGQAAGERQVGPDAPPGAAPVEVGAGGHPPGERQPSAPGPRPAGQPLAPDVRFRLRGVAGPAADVLRVHQGQAADALARAHHADAVTVGQDVHFRAGRFAPRDPAGFGLLAHEATHVEMLIRRGARARATADEGGEEGAALVRERRARRDAGLGAVPAGRGPAARHAAAATRPSANPPVPGTGPAAPSPSRPMAARTERDAGNAPLALDLDGLRRDLVEDLMRQLRTEFERGA